MVLIVGGCSSLPKDYDAPSTSAVTQDSSSSFGQLFKPAYEAHPDKSAFYLLDTAKSAYLARIAIAEVAEKTIDAQYYEWKGDTAGIILANRLRLAAERGVRVRILLDDLTSYGHDRGLAVLNSHPNMEIKLFNPLGRRHISSLSRNLSMTVQLDRMTNRMHNKIFAVDNHVAIMGGRNIGDIYFGLSDKFNFRDMDLFAAGPIATEISESFDHYWNSPWAVPLEEVGIKIPPEKKLAKLRDRMEASYEAELTRFPYPLDFDKKDVLKHLEEIEADFIWAEGEVLSDPVGKSMNDEIGKESPSPIILRLRELGENVKNEALFVSPYLILTRAEIESLTRYIQKGITFKILTNSMITSNSMPVIAHYRKTRKRILETGAQLYEVRPDAVARERHSAHPELNIKHSLHAKIVVLDRKHVFIGTFNLDPRSRYLNTEVGLLVHSPVLSEQVAQSIEKDLQPVNSWRLSLKDQNQLQWTGVIDGEEIHYTSDPKPGFMRRLKSGFFSVLPIKGQL